MKKVILIIIEGHMYNSLKLIEEKAKKHNLIVEKIYLSTESNRKLTWRFFNQKRYFKNLKKDILRYEISKDDILIFSCGEGFEIGNLEKWLPNNLKENKKIAIQHGMFNLHKNKVFELKRKILNIVSKTIFDFNIIGKGFGGVKFNYYIVYSKKYKLFLQNEYRWESNKILVSGSILKGPRIQPQKKKIKGRCLFILQGLFEAGLLDEIEFKNNLKIIVIYLLANYKEVKIRLHPKMRYENYKFLESKNVILTKNTNMIEDVKNVEIAFSFFSTALIDAYLLGVPVVGIYLSKLKFKNYDFLNKVIKYNCLEKELKKLEKYDEYTISNEGIDMTLNIEGIMKKILN